MINVYVAYVLLLVSAAIFTLLGARIAKQPRLAVIEELEGQAERFDNLSNILADGGPKSQLRHCAEMLSKRAEELKKGACLSRYSARNDDE
jgi:hypothetical protein